MLGFFSRLIFRAPNTSNYLFTKLQEHRSSSTLKLLVAILKKKIYFKIYVHLLLLQASFSCTEVGMVAIW
jgi:hypothetical protein